MVAPFSALNDRTTSLEHGVNALSAQNPRFSGGHVETGQDCRLVERRAAAS
jgi:hypothetical protein